LVLPSSDVIPSSLQHVWHEPVPIGRWHATDRALQ
jgi:hypothetical protein